MRRPRISVGSRHKDESLQVTHFQQRWPDMNARLILAGGVRLAVICFVGGWLSCGVWAEETGAVQLAAVEQHAKAGFIFNFAQFTDWPTNQQPQAEAPVTVDVLGEDTLIDVLDPLLTAKKIQGRKVLHRHFQTVAEARQSQVLFISQSEKERLPEIMAALQGLPVLTVSDIVGFVDQGGMIELRTEGQRVVFDLNLGAVRAAKPKLNARLLNLARRVVLPPPRRGAN